MKKMLPVLVLSITVLFAGCDESQSKKNSSDKEKMEFIERMERVYSIQERFIKQNEIYKEMGLVKIVMNPSGGTLYIDGGLYGGSLNNEITLPVGIHEFVVNWNGDYRPSEKKVYVCPALNLTAMPTIEYHEKGNRVNFDINPKPGNLNVTTVNFRGIKR